MKKQKVPLWELNPDLLVEMLEEDDEGQDEDVLDGVLEAYSRMYMILDVHNTT